MVNSKQPFIHFFVFSNSTHILSIFSCELPHYLIRTEEEGEEGEEEEEGEDEEGEGEEEGGTYYLYSHLVFFVPMGLGIEKLPPLQNTYYDPPFFPISNTQHPALHYPYST